MAAGIDTGILTELHGRELGLNANRELVTPQGVVLPRESGEGLKVDIVNPTFPWKDILGPVTFDLEASANRPTLNTYIGNIKQYSFDSDDLAYFRYHIPHDYVPGTDIFVHAHWSHNSALVVSGGVTWGIEATYAKGHNQAAFASPISTSIVALASLVQYRHLVSETPLTAAGGAGGLLDTGLIEPDGIILLRVVLSANDMSAATAPFLHFVDLHYQSTGRGTKNKAPDFN